MKSYKHIPNAEKLQTKLKHIIDDIHTHEDPNVLTEYRRFFKDNVNLFSRTYVSAYLLKKFLVDQHNEFNTAQGKQEFQKSNANNNGNSKLKPNIDSKNQTHTQGSNTHASNGDENKPTRRISINVGSELFAETEIIAYICSAQNIDNSDVLFFKQTQKHTVLMFNNKKIKDLLNHVKHNPLHDKKLYVDLRGRY